MGRFKSPYLFDTDFFDRLINELSLRLGQEMIANEGRATGSAFSDRILVDKGTDIVSAGLGNDVIFTNGTAGSVHYGGHGTDIFVVGARNQSLDPEECLIFDLDGAGLQATQDQILLTHFSADSTIVDLGDGVIQVKDTDGDIATIEVQSQDGKPVDARTIIDSLVFAGDGLTQIDVAGQPSVIVANDLTRKEIREFKSEVRSFQSDTIVMDETVTGRINTGGGDDVLVANLSDAARGDVFEFNTGRGNDVLDINLGLGLVQTVIRNSGVGGNDVLNFTFDLDAAMAPGKCFVNLDDDVFGSTRFVIDGFGDAVEVFDRSDGAVIFRDVATGASFGCYFCDVDDLAVDAAALNESEKFLTDFTWVDPIG